MAIHVEKPEEIIFEDVDEITVGHNWQGLQLIVRMGDGVRTIISIDGRDTESLCKQIHDELNGLFGFDDTEME